MRIDKIKRAVIMALYFFKEINRFEENSETGQSGQYQEDCQHMDNFYYYLMRKQFVFQEYGIGEQQSEQPGDDDHQQVL
jgi:hypothetical protein